jgi:hypothetical protein
MTKQTSQPIGRGSATERDPNTAEKFKFWIRPSQMVNPFDIVAAEHFPAKGSSEASYTFGLVTNIQHITDAAGHLANFISNDFGEEVDEAPQTPRQGANLAEAAVLSNSADIYMPVQNESRVYFADEDKFTCPWALTESPRATGASRTDPDEQRHAGGGVPGSAFCARS